MYNLDFLRELESPYYIMLCGLPASGKSTLRDAIIKNTTGDIRVLSSDDFIQLSANNNNRTYNEEFPHTIKDADNWVNHVLNKAILSGRNIIDDRTNLTPKSRRRKLSNLPKEYMKIAVFVHIPVYCEWVKRLNSRVGKIIPTNVIDNMSQTMVLPTEEEGFDKIIILR